MDLVSSCQISQGRVRASVHTITTSRGLAEALCQGFGTNLLKTAVTEFYTRRWAVEGVAGQPRI